MEYTDATVHIEISRDDYATPWRTLNFDEHNRRLGELISREVGKGIQSLTARTRAGYVPRVKHIEITLRDTPVSARITSEDPHVP